MLEGKFGDDSFTTSPGLFELRFSPNINKNIFHVIFEVMTEYNFRWDNFAFSKCKLSHILDFKMRIILNTFTLLNITGIWNLRYQYKSIRDSHRLRNQIAWDQTNVLKLYKGPFWVTVISEMRGEGGCKSTFDHPPPENFSNSGAVC